MKVERFAVEGNHVLFFGHVILTPSTVAEAKQMRKALYECERQKFHQLGLCDHKAGICASIETDKYKEYDEGDGLDSLRELLP